MPLARFVLASTSPRRAELLRAFGLTPSVLDPDTPEEPREAEGPAQHAERLAREKARCVAARLDGDDCVVLAADTVVALDGTLYGKPRDDAQARGMLRALGGREHEVFTAVHVKRTPQGAEASAIGRTRVLFRAYDERTIDWYLATGESRDKAGAYSIQGQGALLARSIDGSWTNVVGLPLEILPELFARVGLDFLDFVMQARHA